MLLTGNHYQSVQTFRKRGEDVATKEHLTDAEIEAEIKRLSGSPAVKLAIKENNLKNKRKQRLFHLRWLEKRGKELLAKGITPENIEAVLKLEEKKLKKEKTNV